MGTNLRSRTAELAHAFGGDRGAQSRRVVAAPQQAGASRRGLDGPHRLAQQEAVEGGAQFFTALERLPLRGAFIVALPMKIGGGSGAPLRAIAIVP